MSDMIVNGCWWCNDGIIWLVGCYEVVEIGNCIGWNLDFCEFSVEYFCVELCGNDFNFFDCF